MALIPGTRLGPYEITAQIGVGGMGEVYQATDTKLKRQVAIKVLPASVSADAERLARFQREAEVLASLNHPNIAAIYGLEESGGVTALVMELVEGDDLSQRIARGAIPIDEALPIAQQIAEALEAAHEQGIIHRDLKPANIKVRPDGTVKVLDFGLAKAMEPAGAMSPTLSQSPTITTPAMTQAGMILGTAAYMSPEQARGKSVDKRADVWAFGAVLFEVLTGARAFAGDDVSDVLASVLAREPDWARLPADVSPALGTFIRRCLQKDPKQRVRDVGDVRLALEGAFETVVSQATEPVQFDQPPGWRRALPWVVGIALGGIAVGSAVWTQKPPPVPQPPAPVTRVAVTLPETAPLARTGGGQDLAISPDGTQVVYRTSSDTVTGLYARALNQFGGRVLLSDPGVTTVHFSPDGAWVAFSTGADNTWKKVSTRGGPALTLFPRPTTTNPRGASWASDDTIIFAEDSTGLFRGSAVSGEVEALTALNVGRGELGHAWPEVLPGGQAALFTIVRGPGAENMELAVLDLGTMAHKVLLAGGSHAVYAPSGHLVYGVDDALFAVPFDAERLALTGDPVRLVEGVMAADNGATQFSLSGNGSLVYLTGGAPGSRPNTLVWVGRAGRERAIPVPPRSYYVPRISPDGSRVALDVRDQEQDIWIWDFGREVLARLTDGPGPDWSPVWTPDGRRVVYKSRRQGPFSLSWRFADGVGADERLTESAHDQEAYSFLPDGSSLVLGEIGSDNGEDLRVLSLAGSRNVRTLLATGARERNAAVSPDGRWIAYQSNQSGQDEVYVRPLPKVEDGQWQISTNGGNSPRWAADGHELFYRRGFAVLAARVRTEPRFTSSKPEVLFEGDYVGSSGSATTYDVTRDGQRFLMIKEVANSNGAPIPTLVLVLNWLEELKRLVPTN